MIKSYSSHKTPRTRRKSYRLTARNDICNDIWSESSENGRHRLILDEWVQYRTEPSDVMVLVHNWTESFRIGRVVGNWIDKSQIRPSRLNLSSVTVRKSTTYLGINAVKQSYLLPALSRRAFTNWQTFLLLESLCSVKFAGLPKLDTKINNSWLNKKLHKHRHVFHQKTYMTRMVR